MRFSRKRFKRFDEIIEQLYENENINFSMADRRIWKINECFKDLSPRSKAAERKVLRNVFQYLNTNSVLLSGEDFIQAVYNMVKFRPYWKNDLLDWKPTSKQGRVQVNELADHLFARYKMPEFLYKCFFESKSILHIKWFIHIGNGERVKEMPDIPIPFRQKMGHYFLQAPSKFSIAEALRWAQVKGLNGEDNLAERVAYSWIGTKPYMDEDFWEAFLQLLINGAMLNMNKVTELIDFVREAKRENKDYSLKGRKLQSLVRQSDTWHNRFSGYKTNQVWKPCGIEGYRIEKKTEVVVLEELIESRLLNEEGRAMKHCVASYAFYCAKGKSAIFSLRKYSGGILLDTMATIEVNVSLNRVVQAKAKMNKPITEEAKKYMEAWAIKEGLAVNPYL